MRITTDGRVGIGNDSPSSVSIAAADLVVGNTDANHGITIMSSPAHTGSLHFGNSFVTGDASYAGVINYTHDTNTMMFYTSSAARIFIDADGKVGIGGGPGTRAVADYIDQAKARIKSWTAAIKTKLDEEPKADKKAVTLEVTDDAFEVIPTEDLVAEWMAERAIGGGNAKLQVAGDSYFSNSVSVGTDGAATTISNGAIYRTNRSDRSGISLGTGNIFACDYQGAATDGVTDLGSSTYKWKDAHFSGTVNSDGGYFTGAIEVVSGHTRLTGSALYDQTGKGGGDVGIRFQSGAVVAASGSGSAAGDTKDLGSAATRWRDGHFSGTIYGNVDDVPSHVKAITPTQIANWDAGTGGGGGGATTDGRISDTQITNWDKAHGWGNHANAGYQPAGNYALVGASYTKAESDGKYELKGAGGLPAGDWACTGSITAAGNITAYSSSDERLKDDIEAMPVGLIDDIKPSTWNWKDGGKASGGVVAQQLQSCGLEQWVNEAPNGDLGVDYNALIGVLLAEVQSLKARVAELEG
jgi:hypothetical protein